MGALCHSQLQSVSCIQVENLEERFLSWQFFEDFFPLQIEVGKFVKVCYDSSILAEHFRVYFCQRFSYQKCVTVKSVHM